MKKLLVLVFILGLGWVAASQADNMPPPDGHDSRSAPPTTATSDRNPGTMSGVTGESITTTRSSRRVKRAKRAIKPSAPHSGAPLPGANPANGAVLSP